mgnify:CR=1 FL=1
MVNKRTLKKSINIICEEIIAECLAASLYGHNKDHAEALIYCTVKMQDNFIRRVSHPEPGMKARKYYNDLREKFAAQAGEIIDQLTNL